MVLDVGGEFWKYVLSCPHVDKPALTPVSPGVGKTLQQPLEATGHDRRSTGGVSQKIPSQFECQGGKKSSIWKEP